MKRYGHLWAQITNFVSFVAETRGGILLVPLANELMCEELASKQSMC